MRFQKTYSRRLLSATLAIVATLALVGITPGFAQNPSRFFQLTPRPNVPQAPAVVAPPPTTTGLSSMNGGLGVSRIFGSGRDTSGSVFGEITPHPRHRGITSIVGGHVTTPVTPGSRIGIQGGASRYSHPTAKPRSWGGLIFEHTFE